MKFKEKNYKKYNKYTKRTYQHNEQQCPACKKWFESIGRGTNIRQHIRIIAKEEAFYKSLGIIKKTPHLNFYIKSVVVVPHSQKFIWKI